MPERSVQAVRSGDALFAFDADLTVVSWNQAAEELTGVSADDAVGRYCWEVLGGHDERGNLVCHRGCSTARLTRERWPVSRQELLIKDRDGKRPVEISTIAVDEGDRSLFLHVMVPRSESVSPRGPPILLTTRQQQVLGLLAEGTPAKVIAARLRITEATVRNHVRAILVGFRSHSQLEAIAKARGLNMIN